MRTEFPSVTLYFAFAYTFCKVTVHKEQEQLVRQVLDAYKVEYLIESSSTTWIEWDAGLLLRIVCEKLPDLLTKSFPSAKELSDVVSLRLGLKTKP